MVIKENTRKSNLELYRVIVMLLIIAHHYVVNSWLLQLINEDPLAPNAMFLRIFGAWGKTGINCFVLITGYFMCKSQITAKKYAKLLLEIYVYKLTIYGVFLVTGHETLSATRIFELLNVFSGVSDGFVSCFLLFYLLIPFLNLLTQSMNKKQHFVLMVLCLFIYTMLDMVPGVQVRMNYVSWFIVLYMVASYIRLYPSPFYENTVFWGWATLACIGIAVISIVAMALIGKAGSSYFFVSDSNRIMAVMLAVSSFLFFKSWNLRFNPMINKLGAATFGVLLIHGNSDVMIRWLWKEFLNNVEMARSPWLVVHAMCSVFGIFAVCAVIDMLRVRFVEIPFFGIWDKKWPGVLEQYRKIEKKAMQILRIEE